MILRNTFTLSNVAILSAIALILMLPVFTNNQYIIHLTIIWLIWIIISQGLNIIVGYTGYASLAQGAFLGVGAYTSALLTLRLGISFWLALIAAIVVSMLVGAVIGYPSLRMKGHYFAIVTLAFGVIIWIILMGWYQFTGGDIGLSGIERPTFFGISLSSNTNYYYLTAIVCIICIAVKTNFVNSKFGRALKAIRENEPLASTVGINLLNYKMLSFCMSTAFAGIAGSLYAHYMQFINPSPFSIANSLNAILAVIVGGSGTIVGPIIGSFIFVFLPESLRFIEQFRLIIYGLLLIVVVLYMPKGLIYLFQSLYTKLFRLLKNSNT